MFNGKEEDVVAMTPAKSDAIPSAFQEYCLGALNQFLEARELELPFESITGKQENYFKAELKIDDHNLKVFVYHDEAGFFWDDEWVICEEQDFDKDSELVVAFLSQLESRLITTTTGTRCAPG